MSTIRVQNVLWKINSPQHLYVQLIYFWPGLSAFMARAIFAWKHITKFKVHEHTGGSSHLTAALTSYSYSDILLAWCRVYACGFVNFESKALLEKVLYKCLLWSTHFIISIIAGNNISSLHTTTKLRLAWILFEYNLYWALFITFLS